MARKRWKDATVDEKLNTLRKWTILLIAGFIGQLISGFVAQILKAL